ncbi:unnamed protein product, partial [Urochloa humidicola]
DRRGNFRGGRTNSQQWKQREFDRSFEQGTSGEHKFDLTHNLNQNKETAVETNTNEERFEEDTQKKEESVQFASRENHPKDLDENLRKENLGGQERDKKMADFKQASGCGKCGRFGHRTEDYFKPIICSRCKKEGHVPRVCTEIMPWECIAPLCGVAAQGQSFHVILDDEVSESAKDMSNWAMITVKEGIATAKQIENEFKAQAGPNSNWRWYAKKLAENKFQMKFPTAHQVETFAFFTGMQMRTVPNVSIKIDKWNPNAGAKGELERAWFRIFGIPVEKRTEKRACFVGSLVGIPLEVDKASLKRWDFVRVKIGCRDITKVPTKVEGLLDLHFYEFTFQREVQVEGGTNAAGNVWTRSTDRPNEDNPSPKKPRWEKGGPQQQTDGGSSNSETSNTDPKHHRHQSAGGASVMRGVEIKGGSSGIGKSRFGCEQENSAKKSTLNQKSEQEQEFCKDTVMEDPAWI